jgi:hypothetical protein
VLYPLSGALMTLALTVMTVYPIVMMWLPPPKRVRDRPAMSADSND